MWQYILHIILANRNSELERLAILPQRLTTHQCTILHVTHHGNSASQRSIKQTSRSLAAVSRTGVFFAERGKYWRDNFASA